MSAGLEEFRKHFARDRAGSWTCMEQAMLELPEGRIQVTAGTRFVIGTSVLGIDVARLLDEQHDKDKDPNLWRR
jgi:hypothetical protein